MEMEQQIRSSSSTPNLSKLLLRTFSKVFRIRRPGIGIAPEDRIRKIKFDTKKFKNDDEEKIQNQLAMEAFFAKLFACVSSVKAAYAQLQSSQIPYDPDGVQCADKMVVDELKHLAELKLSFLNKQNDRTPPQVTVLLAELQEQKSLLKMYEISGKKLESEIKLKDSEITFLREKMDEFCAHNRMLEAKIDASESSIAITDRLTLMELNVCHFVSVRRYVIDCVRSFVKLMLHNISVSGWDLVAAANAIEPNVVDGKLKHVYVVFESFVCRTMFDAFQYPKFCVSNQQRDPSEYFDRFMELKATNVDVYLESKPRSTFGKFCRLKYLSLIHPKMELAFFGDLKQRNIVDSGGYPETHFFTAFAEMARRVWLLHCLAFSFEPEGEASIFQVRKGCRFSEVFMENVVEDDDPQLVDPRVGFTVIPGFKIGKTVIQCQVYLS